MNDTESLLREAKSYLMRGTHALVREECELCNLVDRIEAHLARKPATVAMEPLTVTDWSQEDLRELMTRLWDCAGSQFIACEGKATDRSSIKTALVDAAQLIEYSLLAAIPQSAPKEET